MVKDKTVFFEILKIVRNATAMSNGDFLFCIVIKIFFILYSGNL